MQKRFSFRSAALASSVVAASVLLSVAAPAAVAGTPAPRPDATHPAKDKRTAPCDGTASFRLFDSPRSNKATRRSSQVRQRYEYRRLLYPTVLGERLRFRSVPLVRSGPPDVRDQMLIYFIDPCERLAEPRQDTPAHVPSTGPERSRRTR
ncbi:hypothetical protein [Streptomyces sp. NPDC014734]|uniref:hypothetical protein n=1 Tax=Streptomyces sp. NPDC014734 TaxID=3364886 RepID=UPI003700539D